MNIFRTFGRRLRLGVIGGGPGSFVGAVHRAAARIDDNFEIVAGVLSSDPVKSKMYGRDIGLAEDRAYGSVEEMFAAEHARPDGIDVVAIMSSNGTHCQYAESAVKYGLDIICDKPLGSALDECLALAKSVKEAGLVFCQTFSYTGFPMVRQARAMVREGDIGDIRMVQVECVQGYAAEASADELSANPANWRFHPDLNGPSLIFGDIGCHAHHMVSFVTGQEVVRLTAEVKAVVPGRKTSDTAGVLFNLENGASGMMWVTNAGPGAVHGLRFRVFGSKGGLEWFQEEPNQLFHSRLGQSTLTLERRGFGLKGEADRVSRVGIGHPEGYFESFASLYSDAAEAIVKRRLGQDYTSAVRDMPTIEDGVRAMKFMDAALESSQTGCWVDSRVYL
ncbi:Gfo/Idh/MocA family protein [Pantoea cypripedii]|uniref:Oxidoreductase n=1 Tax=Pantoea cypripedii TaxID=55209 RepID=A0A6B9G5G0_PANCY|nr:Gfo/Idh/MocA family oxidoreductase [Pantoea cypripedii]QGY32951.1 oxidoreductase [Pantoea cypripedii]